MQRHGFRRRSIHKIQCAHFHHRVPLAQHMVEHNQRQPLRGFQIFCLGRLGKSHVQRGQAAPFFAAHQNIRRLHFHAAHADGKLLRRAQPLAETQHRTLGGFRRCGNQRQHLREVFQIAVGAEYQRSVSRRSFQFYHHAGAVFVQQVVGLGNEGHRVFQRCEPRLFAPPHRPETKGVILPFAQAVPACGFVGI